MPVKMEVPHEWDMDIHRSECVPDSGHRGSGFFFVDCDAHEFGACAHKVCDLCDGGIDILRVGIGHGLHNDWGGPAHRDPTH